MAEILVRAGNTVHSDPSKDQRGCYKRGMPVVVMPDGHPWGAEEGLPKFVIVKIPLISVDRVQQYIAPQVESGVVTRRRRWQIRWADLPAGAQTILQTTGVLTIKASASYAGSYGYTWAQVRSYFRDLLTGLDESGNL